MVIVVLTTPCHGNFLPKLLPLCVDKQDFFIVWCWTKLYIIFLNILGIFIMSVTKFLCVERNCRT